MAETRAHWGSKFGFILAASGSAVGLGNIWKFPYITGENGGGIFVIIYLLCILLIGIPILIGEILIGKTTQESTVPAFRQLSKPASPWMSFGWLGVIAAFLLLSYYGVVAGWTMHYGWLALSGSFVNQTPDQINAIFGEVASSPTISIYWQIAFMACTIVIVAFGVKKGIELAAKIMLPALFLILLILLVRAAMTDGFGQAANFIFGLHTDQLTSAGVLEALGHSFFTLSIGMGTMIAYGSYLHRKSDVVGTSLVIGGLDTLIALLACMVLFPITFASGFGPRKRPGPCFPEHADRVDAAAGRFILRIDLLHPALLRGTHQRDLAVGSRCQLLRRRVENPPSGYSDRRRNLHHLAGHPVRPEQTARHSTACSTKAPRRTSG